MSLPENWRGELEGPAVEIQVRCPGGEPNLDIPADLTEVGTKIHLAHVDTDFGSGTRSGQPFEITVLNVSLEYALNNKSR